MHYHSMNISSQTYYVSYKKSTNLELCNISDQNHIGIFSPSISEGNKVTLTPPPVFQGDVSNLFNSEEKCLGKFMSSMYFIIFGILQDSQKCLGL